MHDVAVVGLGPAGRSLASACAAAGLDVLAVDPAPEAVWSPTYGVWDDELAGLPSSVVRHRVARPELRARGRHPLHRGYAVLDNVALQQALPLETVEVRRGRLDDAGVAALRSEARVVVDARGARPDGPLVDDAAAQTAYGIVVTARDAAPALQGAEGLLMDWTTDWTTGGATGTATGTAGEDRDRERDIPTFLYAIPLGADRVLLEETCLAAAPGLGIAELRTRLTRRLRARGVAEEVLAEPLAREVVRIPMRGREVAPPPGVLAVGVAGRGGHLVTGYSVAHSLRSGRELADRIAAGDVPAQVDPPGSADLVREAGLRALLRMDTAGTVELFEAFGRLGATRQRDFMARGTSAGPLLAAMWQMFVAMPGPGRVALTRATLGAPWQGLRLGRR